MRMHTIPQNVTSYEDKIVGQFVGRQFIYLAVGGMIDFLLLTTPVGPLAIRFFLAIIIGAFAAAMALLKLQDRGFDVWVFAFFRAVLGPTEWTWKKQAIPAAVLLPDEVKTQQNPAQANQAQATPDQPKLAPRERVDQFEQFLSKSHGDLDEHEQDFLNKLDFGALPPDALYDHAGPPPAMLTPQHQQPTSPEPEPAAPLLPVNQKPVTQLAQSTRDPKMSFSVDGKESSIPLHQNQEVSRSLSRQLLSGGMLPLPVRGELHLSLSQGLKQELSQLIGFSPTSQLNKAPVPTTDSGKNLSIDRTDQVELAPQPAELPDPSPTPPAATTPPASPSVAAPRDLPAPAPAPTPLGSTFRIPHKPLQLVTEIEPVGSPPPARQTDLGGVASQQSSQNTTTQPVQDLVNQDKIADQQRQMAEEAARVALEQAHKEEAARRAAEEQQLAEQKRLQQEQEAERQKLAEEQRLAAERAADEARKAEEARRLQEAEALRQVEEQRLVQIEAEMRAKAQAEIERVRLEAENKAQAALEAERQQKDQELQSVMTKYQEEMAQMQEHTEEVEEQSKETAAQLERMEEQLEQLKERPVEAEAEPEQASHQAADNVVTEEDQTKPVEATGSTDLPLPDLPAIEPTDRAESEDEQPAETSQSAGVASTEDFTERPLEQQEEHTGPAPILVTGQENEPVMAEPAEVSQLSTERPQEEPAVAELTTEEQVAQPVADLGSGINNEPTMPTSERIQRLAEEVRNAPKPDVVDARVLNDKNMLALTNQPNVINGVVFDKDNQFLGGVVVVIKDDSGEPKRALKTNKLGQFVITTPLPDGQYTVEVEKKGTTFDIMRVHLDGSLLPPLRIQGR